jgi:hypothetical protein
VTPSTADVIGEVPSASFTYDGETSVRVGFDLQGEALPRRLGPSTATATIHGADEQVEIATLLGLAMYAPVRTLDKSIQRKIHVAYWVPRFHRRPTVVWFLIPIIKVGVALRTESL